MILDILLLKILSRTGWLNKLPPLSLFLGYERTVSLATITGICLCDRRLHFRFKLRFSFNHFWSVGGVIKPSLASSKTLLFFISINDGFIVGGNTSNWQLGISILHASFMNFPSCTPHTLVSEVESRRIYLGPFFPFLLLSHLNILFYFLTNKLLPFFTTNWSKLSEFEGAINQNGK